VEHYIKTNQVDILLVSETHFTRSHSTISGYETINALHPGHRIRGGASIIIRRGIQYEELKPVQLEWMQCAKIHLIISQSKIIIAAAYLPPRYTLSQTDLSDILPNPERRFLIGGDFNAKDTWWGSRTVNPKRSTLLGCIRALGCAVYPTGETTYWPTENSGPLGLCL